VEACVIRAAVLAALVLGLAAPASAADAPSPPRPTGLVVALSLGDSRLQAGVVRGRDVILARGFEVELARILARRLGGRVARFVDVRPAGRLLASGAPGWHLALASIDPSSARRAGVAPSVPYLTTDLAVVLRRGLERPRRLADLRRRVVCVIRGSEAGPVVGRAIRPLRAPLVAPGRDRLGALLRTGACDAAVVGMSEAGRLLARQRGLLGPVAGRIRHGEGLVIAVARGTGLAPALVDRELRRMRADGTLGRLARSWLGLDPAALPRLR
jgi:ABC-type amino acid transport substrate-binding protein